MTETIYLWDRMNTVFKFYLQMWLLLTPAALTLASMALRRTRGTVRLGTATAFGLTGALRLPTWLPDAQFADHLRQRYDTQIVPGTMFEAPGTLRLSFGLPPEDLERALANISAALDDLS